MSLTVFYQIFSANFICQFDLTLYPFDIQPCEVQITLNEKQLEYTRYHNSSLHMVNKIEVKKQIVRRYMYQQKQVYLQYSAHGLKELFHF